MSLNWTSYVSDLANLMVVPTSDPNFQTMLPNAIDQAEQYLYRELDLMATIQRDMGASFTTGSRSFTLPATNATFVIVKRINVITPAGTATADLGTRNALTPASAEMLDMIWPSSSGSTVPTYFAMQSQSGVIVGPWPDQAYTIEVVGTFRPNPLSATNVTTVLSVYFPDLFLSASMIFATGYQRDFGAAGNDDPKQAINWRQNTEMLLTSAKTEEMRKRLSEHGVKQIVPPEPETRA